MGLEKGRQRDMLSSRGLGILGSLIESEFHSLKSFFDEVRLRLDKAGGKDIIILGLAYNVVRLVQKA